jgi:hypothetical protein
MSKQLVGMLLCIFVQDRHLPFITEVLTGSAGVGIMGMMGNKGGVAIRFKVGWLVGWYSTAITTRSHSCDTNLSFLIFSSTTARFVSSILISVLILKRYNDEIRITKRYVMWWHQVPATAAC